MTNISDKIGLSLTRYVILIVILLIGSIKQSSAQLYMWTFQLDKAGRQEASIELDPYYSCAYYTVGLTDTPIPKEQINYESELYWHMIKNFYLPRFVLIEASVYPLPITGVMLKKHSRDFYDDSELIKGVNFIKAVTEGFPEPWATSLLIGNVANFVKGEDNDIVGKGFSGLLLSFGNQHIVDNIMVDDYWLETELKLKGTDLREIHSLSYSYGIGVKKHFNEEIRDQLYISIKRNRIDYRKGNMNPFLGFFVRNTEQQLRMDFDLERFYKGKISKLLVLLGKNFPIGDGSVTLSFSAGFLKIFGDSYTGTLKQEVGQEWIFLVRPNIHLKFD
ncbi:MAG: hypothetical protein CVV44_04315 [Spirochaetae bacterium HGW-Spirochaetae-1]|nr:MAG: hypothetical protein CVV44_04315 [Spirochaetae bacterium HGW-Spirochaetae-1]